MRVGGFVATVVTALVAATGCAGTVRDNATVVFAASSLTEAADELVTAYQADGGGDVDVVVGGSAALAAQIRDGAPAGVFLSADRRLADEVAASCSDPCRSQPFARNSLVLAAPAGNQSSATGLADLARPDLRVVLCAPEVPCGALGAELTSRYGVTPAPDSLESSVRAVRTRLELDEADLGLVYATDLSGELESIPVPGIDETMTSYHMVVLDSEQAEAEQLAAFITGPDGQLVLAGLGFAPVDP